MRMINRRSDEIQRVVAAAHRLLEALIWALAKIGFPLSLLKCKNFLIYVMGRAHDLFKRGYPFPRCTQAKKYARYRALQISVGAAGSSPTQAAGPPFQIVNQKQLVGLRLDGLWAFHDYMREVQNKARIRTGVISKVGNSRWGLETKVLTITVHVLIESLLNNGLTVAGSAAVVKGFDGANPNVLNPAARRMAGVGVGPKCGRSETRWRAG